MLNVMIAFYLITSVSSAYYHLHAHERSLYFNISTRPERDLNTGPLSENLLEFDYDTLSRSATKAGSYTFSLITISAWFL